MTVAKLWKCKIKCILQRTSLRHSLRLSLNLFNIQSDSRLEGEPKSDTNIILIFFFVFFFAPSDKAGGLNEFSFSWESARKRDEYAVSCGSSVADVIRFYLGKSARFAYSQWLVRFSVCLRVCMSVKIVLTIGHILAKIKKVKNDVCRFWQLPSNGVIAKIALRDLDLLFEGKNVKSVYLWKCES